MASPLGRPPRRDLPPREDGVPERAAGPTVVLVEGEPQRADLDGHEVEPRRREGGEAGVAHARVFGQRTPRLRHFVARRQRATSPGRATRSSGTPARRITATSR